jgi:hypothetical protein
MSSPAWSSGWVIATAAGVFAAVAAGNSAAIEAAVTHVNAASATLQGLAADDPGPQPAA